MKLPLFHWTRRLERAARAGLILIGLGLLLFNFVRIIVRPIGDFHYHWQLGNDLLNGRSLYLGPGGRPPDYPNPYPPFWAMVHAPLTIFSAHLAQILVFLPLYLGSLGLLLWILHRLTQPHLPLDRTREFWATALAMLIAVQFLARDMAECGINIALVGLAWFAIYAWTRDPRACPEEPTYVEIGFKQGLPVSLDGEPVAAVDIVATLNRVGGENGVGRIDHLENRLIGIKSREIYEAPAAVLLLQAHQALEDITLPKEVARFKEHVAQQWAQLVYDGLWFSPLRDALYAFVAETQRHVTGDVRLKLYRGSSHVVGRKAPHQLYELSLATYGKGDQFDQSAAAGFIKLWGMGVRTSARVQGRLDARDLGNLLGEAKRLGS